MAKRHVKRYSTSFIQPRNVNQNQAKISFYITWMVIVTKAENGKIGTHTMLVGV